MVGLGFTGGSGFSTLEEFAMKAEPYLFFEGRCEEALQFYSRALGARVGMVMKYKDAPDKPPEGMVPPGSENKIMHSEFQVGETRMFASDGSCTGQSAFGGFSLSLPVKTPAEADKLFNALADGGQVQMPLGQTFFSPRFGMVQDKFGVGWIVIVEQPMK
jgi:PhnB protein